MDGKPPLLELETGCEPSRPFYFGQGIASQLPAYLRRFDFDRCFLITSPHLFERFGNDLKTELTGSGIPCEVVPIGDSERHKSWDDLRSLCELLVSAGVTKDSIVLAMGGGVLGNLVGLTAALIYRGVRFIQIPTTITAQTDSTLSNKQAINGALGKNQFGVYHAPLFVWADAAYVRTEPTRQQKSGIVEGIKNVFISQNNLDAAQRMLELWRAGERAMPELLLTLIRSKLEILRRDPGERHHANILEYGHTFGHAIEWLSRGNLLHGEAISIGMCIAAELSHAMGHLPEPLLRDHYRLLGDELQMPTRLPASIRHETLYETMLADNKRTGKGLRFLLLRGWADFVGSNDENLMAPAEREIVLKVLEEAGETNPHQLA
jgi:3-dehydroquinate synthase